MRMAALTATLAMFAFATSARAQFGTNLVVNGNAEVGAVGGFTTTGGFEAVAYN